MQQEDKLYSEFFDVLIAHTCYLYNKKHKLYGTPKLLPVKKSYNRATIEKLLTIEEIAPTIKKILMNDYKIGNTISNEFSYDEQFGTWYKPKKEEE